MIPLQGNIYVQEGTDASTLRIVYDKVSSHTITITIYMNTICSNFDARYIYEYLLHVTYMSVLLTNARLQGDAIMQRHSTSANIMYADSLSSCCCVCTIRVVFCDA
jgi:prepilin-type processing-associated H-X9-DG protein